MKREQFDFMKKVLSIINCHEKLEFDRFKSLKSIGLENDLEIFGLSRFSGNELDLLPIFIDTSISCKLDSLDKYLEIFLEILEAEIRSDRLFCRIGDFSLPTRRKLPKNLHKELKFVALRILQIFELTTPDYVMLGHADNWISTSISRLCTHLNIKSGLAMQMFPGLEYYLATSNHSYSNPKIVSSLFNQFEDLGLDEFPKQNVLDSFKIGTKTKKSLQPGKAWKRIAGVPFQVIKQELYSIKALNLKMKSNHERWKFIHKRIPILDMLKTSIYAVRGYFNCLVYFILAKKGEKVYKSINDARRIVYLHMSPEAATLWYGRRYVNQFRLVQEVLELSTGAKVFVKEHPAQLFQLRKMFFYFRIRYAGAFFLPREFSPITSMRDSDAVISISGSVAFEANSKQKHCFLAYDGIWYNSLPFVHKLAELRDYNFNSWPNKGVRVFSENEIISILMRKGVVFSSKSEDGAQMVACKLIMGS